MGRAVGEAVKFGVKVVAVVALHNSPSYMDVAPWENELPTPALYCSQLYKVKAVLRIAIHFEILIYIIIKSIKYILIYTSQSKNSNLLKIRMYLTCYVNSHPDVYMSI